MGSLIDQTEAALARVLGLCSSGPVGEQDVDALQRHDEAALALLDMNDDDAMKALGPWIKCLEAWSHKTNAAQGGEEGPWTTITQPCTVVLSRADPSSETPPPPPGTPPLAAHKALTVILFRVMLLGEETEGSPHRNPSPAAWAAARAYLLMLSLPGAAPYGVLQSAVLGMVLTNLRSWCRNSGVYRPGGGGAPGVEGGGVGRKKGPLKRRRGEYAEGGEDGDSSDGGEETGPRGVGRRAAGGGGRGSGGEVLACLELLKSCLACVSLESHQDLVVKLSEVLVGVSVVAAIEGPASLADLASASMVGLVTGASGHTEVVQGVVLQTLMPVILMTTGKADVPPRSRDCIKAHNSAVDTAKAIAAALRNAAPRNGYRTRGATPSTPGQSTDVPSEGGLASQSPSATTPAGGGDDTSASPTGDDPSVSPGGAPVVVVGRNGDGDGQTGTGRGGGKPVLTLLQHLCVSSPERAEGRARLAEGLAALLPELEDHDRVRFVVFLAKVTVIRDGKTFTVESADICRGDLIKVEGGDLIPADVRIIDCSDNMVVDNAPLTGESEPQKRKTFCTHDDPMETQNLAFFGTSCPEGSCAAVVCRTADNTLMGQIAGLAMSTDNEETPINKEIEHFIKIISAIAIILGVVFFVLGFVVETPLIQNLVFMIGIIVANVPEGLLATVTVCLTLTAKRMHKKQVLVKNLEGVETLGSTSCICSDKTGTLTQNIMTVAQIVYGQEDGTHIEDCASSFTKGNSTYDENDPGFKGLQRCATLCNVSVFQEDSKSDKNGPVPFKKMKVQGDGSAIEVVAWKAVGNASEIAMIKFVQEFRDIEDYRAANPNIFKIPFNSKNKYQVHVVKQEDKPDGERLVVMKGAPERIIDRCSEVMLGSRIVPMTPELKAQIEAHQETLSRNGLRVLGFAEREMNQADFPTDYAFGDGKDEGYSTPNFPLGEFANAAAREQAEKAGGASSVEPPIHPKSKEGLVFLGLMALIDPPREAVPGAVGKCKTAGIKVVMVTGDHPITAQAIAYKVGILWSKTRGEIEASNKRYNLEPGDANFEDPENAQAIVVPGWEISPEMEQDKWDAILEHPQIVFARTSPQQKLVIVENNQRVGHIVAVTGDGVNDSPALKKADIGIAMGIMGSAVSKQAADMILLDDNFASIVSGVEEGRLIFDNLKKSIAYTLTSNIPEISPFICFITLGTPPPLSTVLILAIDLGTDMVPAISMSYEQAEADIMRRPPRNSAIDRLVTKKLIIYAYLQIGIIQAAAGFYTWLVVLNDYGYPPHILIGLGRGDYFGKQPLMCKFAGGGGQYANTKGEISTELNPLTDPPTLEFPLWDTGAGGYVDTCYFPLKLVDENGGTQTDFDRYDSATYLDDGVDPTTPEDLESTIKSASSPGIPIEAMQGLMLDGYFHYIPWKGRMSPFWDNDWLHWDITKTEDATGSLGGSSSLIYFSSYPAGLYSSCLGESGLTSTTGSVFAAPSAEDALKTANNGERPTGASFASLAPPYNFTYCNDTAEVGTKPYVYNVFCNGDGNVAACAEFDSFTMENVHYCEDECSLDCNPLTSAERSVEGGEYVQCQNIANRMVQKEALQHGQASFFVAIVIVQWADLMICKTRWLSIRTQGMINSAMNFGLFFETLLAAWLCYCPPINVGLGTRNLRLVHWFPAMPFSMIIFMYDEIRKYLMRTTSPEVMDKSTGQVKRIAGWLERNTYY